ncbi:hypothetical protein GCM10026983_37270 [Gracilibacillus alcaliphilus]
MREKLFVYHGANDLEEPAYAVRSRGLWECTLIKLVFIIVETALFPKNSNMLTEEVIR